MEIGYGAVRTSRNTAGCAETTALPERWDINIPFDINGRADLFNSPFFSAIQFSVNREPHSQKAGDASYGI